MAGSNTKYFNVVFRKLVNHHDISFRKLSKLTGITHPHLVGLSTGKHSNPRLDTLQKISNFFGVSMAQLVGEQEIDFANLEKKSYLVSARKPPFYLKYIQKKKTPSFFPENGTNKQHIPTNNC